MKKFHICIAFVPIILLSCCPCSFGAQVLSWGGMSMLDEELVNIKTISAGGSFSLAINEDGKIIGWGDNRFGQATGPDGNDF